MFLFIWLQTCQPHKCTGQVVTSGANLYDWGAKRMRLGCAQPGITQTPRRGKAKPAKKRSNPAKRTEKRD
eukprot:3235783-Amphidinium_carterae.1